MLVGEFARRTEDGGFFWYRICNDRFARGRLVESLVYRLWVAGVTWFKVFRSFRRLLAGESEYFFDGFELFGQLDDVETGFNFLQER